MRYLCLLLLCFLLLSLCSLGNQQDATKEKSNKVVEVARSYSHVRETKENRGLEVDSFNKPLKNIGGPWCASFVSHVLTKAKAVFPKIRTALAQKFITKNSVKAKHVAKGYKTAEAGWLAIWKRGNTINGHVGILTERTRCPTFKTTEGNVRVKGKQGVFEMTRKITDLFSFRVAYFTPTEI